MLGPLPSKFRLTMSLVCILDAKLFQNTHSASEKVQAPTKVKGLPPGLRKEPPHLGWGLLPRKQQTPVCPLRMDFTFVKVIKTMKQISYVACKP